MIDVDNDTFGGQQRYYSQEGFQAAQQNLGSKGKPSANRRR